MIPFEELSAALDRWRLRNGLPLATADLPASQAPATYAAPVSSYASPAAFAAPATYAAPAASYSTPSAPRTVSAEQRPATNSEVLALGDEEMVEEQDEMYENEGADFAMNFQPASGNPVGSVAGSIGGGSGPTPVAAQPLDDDSDYGDADQATYMPEDGAYAAYGEPPAAPLPALADELAPPPVDEYPAYGDEDGDAQPVGEAEVEAEEDEEAVWARLYASSGAGGAPSGDTLDAEHDVIDEATVVGDATGRPKR